MSYNICTTFAIWVELHEGHTSAQTLQLEAKGQVVSYEQQPQQQQQTVRNHFYTHNLAVSRWDASSVELTFGFVWGGASVLEGGGSKLENGCRTGVVVW